MSIRPSFCGFPSPLRFSVNIQQERITCQRLIFAFGNKLATCAWGFLTQYRYHFVIIHRSFLRCVCVSVNTKHTLIRRAVNTFFQECPKELRRGCSQLATSSLALATVRHLASSKQMPATPQCVAPFQIVICSGPASFC